MNKDLVLSVSQQTRCVLFLLTITHLKKWNTKWKGVQSCHHNQMPKPYDTEYKRFQKHINVFLDGGVVDIGVGYACVTVMSSIFGSGS